MAIYLFKCSSCNQNFELEKSMKEEFKSEQLICKECGDVLKRDYNAEAKPTIVPDNMKATELGSYHNNLDFTKSPSGKKHHYGGYTGN